MRGRDAVLSGGRCPRCPGSRSWPCLLVSLSLFASCRDAKRNENAPPESPPSSAGSQAALAPSGAAAAPSAAIHEDELNHGIPHSPEPPPLPPGASATALRSSTITQLTTLRVSARIGSVILRKEGDVWRVAGAACPVPPRKMERALRSLAQLNAVPAKEADANDAPSELQLVAEAEGVSMLHFDIGNRTAAGDLVRLINGKAYRVKGLDRALWSTSPAAWCVEP